MSARRFTQLALVAGLLFAACRYPGEEVELIEYRGRVLTSDTIDTSLVYPEFTPSEAARPVPVAGAVIKVTSAKGEVTLIEVKSDAQGYFAFQLPKTNEPVVMTIAHDNYNTATQDFVNGPFNSYKATTTLLFKKPKL